MRNVRSALEYRRSPASRRNAAGPTERLIGILECFTHDTPALTAEEITARTGLPRSTAYRLLAWMARRGLLVHDARGGRYHPGLRLLELGAIAAEQMELRQAARPILRELLEQTGETVNLSVYHNGHRICVEKVDSIHDIRGVIHVGKPYPLHAGAAGKAILALLPPSEVERILRHQPLERFTDRTLVRKADLLRSLAEIRRTGVAVSHGERVEGATAVSAPIFDGQGQVVASITVSGPSFRFTPERLRRYRDLVKDAAAHLTRAIGGRLPRQDGERGVVRRGSS